ncbi:glycosyltransferase family 4 protein [Myroides injenensis]|uniref:glycosyltransferase family 4 protein n=1 Tax=Myroides injenensis TaxID=1183151 RepID=UPI000288D1CC|nr:glycosyltransferase family 4 protein [Myroides injenensis]
MKILIDSYNTMCQNTSGGVQTRVKKHLEYLTKRNKEYKLFDKWNDKVEDFDIIHIFKITLDSYNLVNYSSNKGKKIVLSSVIAIEKKINIKLGLLISKIFRVKTGYWFTQQMLLQSDAIVAQTIKEAKFIEENYSIDSSKIHIIPNGINLVFKYRESQLAFEILGYRKPYVLQVGRFDRNKNQLNVIKALKGTGIPVVFVGGEYFNEKAYYKECRDLADENFVFIDWLKHGDELLESLYVNAQVLVLPSHKEIFGNVLFEGGAAGINLAVTDVLPIESFGISKFCTSFKASNINSIKNAVMKEYYKDKIAGQSKFFIENFSWDEAVIKYIDIYNSLINVRKE